MRSTELFILLSCMMLSACGGSVGDSIGGDSNASLGADLTGMNGYWIMKSLEVNNSPIALLDLSESVEIDTGASGLSSNAFAATSSGTMKITSISGSCAAQQTFTLENGRITDDDPIITCSGGACDLSYYIYTTSGANYVSIRCPQDFPLVSDAIRNISKTATTVTLSEQHGSSTVEYIYQKMVGHSSYGSLLPSITTNGPNIMGIDSYLDCVDSSAQAFSFALLDDGNGFLSDSNGVFDAFWWTDVVNGILMFYLPDANGFYYGTELDTDLDGYIETFRFYSSASTGFTYKTATCTKTDI